MGPYLLQQKAFSLWENGRLSNEQMQLKKEQWECQNQGKNSERNWVFLPQVCIVNNKKPFAIKD